MNSGIDAVNSGPIILRTYNNSNNKTIILTDYDKPVSNNYVLITSTNGVLVPSDNIYVSSIYVSTINGTPYGPTGSNEPNEPNESLLYPTTNNIIFTDKNISGNWSSVAVSSSGQYQTALSNTIWYSTNYGVTWTQCTQTELTGSWKSVAVSSSGQYQTAVVNYGSIWYSIDYGVTWTICSQTELNELLWNSVAVSSSGQYQTAVHSIGNIWYSTNYGVTWTQCSQTELNGLNWYSVAVSSSGQYQTTVNINSIWYSSNYGVTWTKYNQVYYGLYIPSVALSSSGQYQTIIIINGTIWYSTNYGVTWNPCSQNELYGLSWMTVTMSSSGQYQIAADNNNNTWYSMDYGVTWTNQLLNGYWRSVSMSSSGQYITAVGSTIYTTTIPIPSTSYLTNSNILIGNIDQTLTGPTGSIYINASEHTVTGFSGYIGACYISPLRNSSNAPNIVYYNNSTKELTWNGSTEIYKSNIVDLVDTSSLYNLVPREFDYLDGNHCVGFIAEEVDKIDTMLSTKNEDGTPCNINWFGITTYLVHEVKKLNERLKLLEI
jgi:photosystem II stability/assembly factor-like uncharacterized protein